MVCIKRISKRNLAVALCLLGPRGTRALGSASSRQMRHLPGLPSHPFKYPLQPQKAFLLYSTTTDNNDINGVSASSSSSWDEPEVWTQEDTNESPESTAVATASIDPIVQEYQAWKKALEKALVKIKKKQTSLESELQKAQKVEETVRRAQLIVSNLYLFPSKDIRKATVNDWEQDGIEVELTLNPKYESASAEADALFAQARKLKRGSQVLEGLFQETQAAMETLQEAQADLESAQIDESSSTIDIGRLELVKGTLTRTARTTNFQIPTVTDPAQPSANQTDKNKGARAAKPALGTPASNVRKLISPGGCTVWVGRNRRGNEYLSLTLARQDDVWMHSRGCPGAHVIVQNRRGEPDPTEDCLQFAADVAIFYSDLRTEAKAAVTAAEPEHLLKPRGAPLGAIKVREEWRTFVGRPDRVPDELKEAREQSGQSKEYRQEDKGKRRKRTKLAAKEANAKRKKAKNKK